MIKLINILKEVITTSHYLERKTERGKIVDVVIPPQSYEGYELTEVKNKLIPLLESELLKQLNSIENRDLEASNSFNVGLKVFEAFLENKETSYPITIVTKSTVGDTSVEKENTGVLYLLILINNSAVTLLLTNKTSSDSLKQQISSHLKRKNPDNNKEIKILSGPDYKFTINVNTLFGKEIEKSKSKFLVKKEDLPYTTFRTDYRVGANFTHKNYGTGTIVASSSGTRGLTDSRGVLDWIDVDFKKPYLSKGKLTSIRRIPDIYSKLYFDQQLKQA